MCGISGFIGKDGSKDILLDCLRRLEYRGYDSSGLAILNDSSLSVVKRIGFVKNLENATKDLNDGHAGIAHTRWATHGKVTEANAHPHVNEKNSVAIVHNGIIENSNVIREKLESDGVKFKSETDTEVIVHLLSSFYYENNVTKGNAVESLRATFSNLVGTWGVAVIFSDCSDKIYAIRNGSPLVVGLSGIGSLISSDSSILTPYTRRVVFLDDGEIAEITSDNLKLYKLDGGNKDFKIQELDYIYQESEKNEFQHFMLKEIYEQPTVVKNCITGRYDFKTGTAKLDGLNLSSNDLLRLNNVGLIGCGTSFYACQAGAHVIQNLSRIDVSCHIASEFRYSNPIINSNSLYFALSQSGETADTLGAIKEIKLKGANVKGIVNVVGSSIARECKSGVYIHSGPEISVASTKAFSNMFATLCLFAIKLGRVKSLGLKDGQSLLSCFSEIPDKIKEYLSNPGKVDDAVSIILNASRVLFMGRGISSHVASEGALKLMEVSYIPSIAYPSGEMKHGPLALIDTNTPVVVIAPDDNLKEKTLSNLQECKARGAKVILIHTEGDEVAKHGDVSISIPRTSEYFTPLLTVLPLQLIAYYTGLSLDRSIDKPRNLAKSVTVE